MASIKYHSGALIWTSMVFFSCVVNVQSNLFASSEISQIILNPTHETIIYHVDKEDISFDAVEELTFASNDVSDIESVLLFDLVYALVNDVALKHVSRALLKVYQLRGDLNTTSFDVDGGDTPTHISGCDPSPCWVAVDLTAGLLSSIKHDHTSFLEVFISTEHSHGAFAASAYKGGQYAPKLILDFHKQNKLDLIDFTRNARLKGSNPTVDKKKQRKKKRKNKKKRPGRKPGKEDKPPDKKPTAQQNKPVDANQQGNKNKPVGEGGKKGPSKTKPESKNKPTNVKPGGKKDPSKTKPGNKNKPTNAKPGGKKGPSKTKPGSKSKLTKAKSGGKKDPSKTKPGSKNKPSNAKPGGKNGPLNTKPGNNTNGPKQKPPNAPEKPKPKPQKPRPADDIGPSSNAKPPAPSPSKPKPPASPTSASSKTLKILESKENIIIENLLMYDDPIKGLIQSVYTFDALITGLSVMSSKGVAGKTFYLGNDDKTKGSLYGIVNIAAFLAQSMKETIKYNACDENSWDLVDGKYPLSNACGQLGQSYQDYHCPANEKHMECPVDPNMEITAVTHATWYGAPGPLYCKPKKSKNDFTGYWDYQFDCNNPWAEPPTTCDVYEGQKAGMYNNTIKVANSAGRVDVEGCCWWGRGVIQTTGVCNFGKLNYYLGARAAKEGRNAPYADIDFCKNPEVICSSQKYKELKWIAGMFYWMESMQSYDTEGWNYMEQLHAFVDGGLSDPSFINAVSGIVNRGCHNPPCRTGEVDGALERSGYFSTILSIFNSR